MITLIVMAAAAVVALAAAIGARRFQRRAPTSAMTEPPSALDRRDFRSPEAPWLIAVFTSASCSSCAAVLSELRGYESSDLVVQDVEVGASPELHRKYKIESVPTAVVARADGDAKLAFVGPIGPDQRQALAATVRSR